MFSKSISLILSINKKYFFFKGKHMSTIVERFDKIKLNIASAKPKKPVNIIAVSKTFELEYIRPLIDYGHVHFGENRVQEASTKWSELKKTNLNLKLHMIGKLQSNKAKDAVNIFDYIHSLDNQKLADSLSKHQKNLNKNILVKFKKDDCVFKKELKEFFSNV